MKAGRELDALVAEKVMGSVVEWLDILDGYVMSNSDIENPVFDKPVFGKVPVIREHGVIAYDDVLGVKINTLPHYSTDIAAAWQVVRHFTDNGTCNHHFTMEFWADSGTWSVEIGGRECGAPARPYRLPQDLWSESLSHAICLAVLKAVGVDVEEKEPA
jgi:hypothetical protein